MKEHITLLLERETQFHWKPICSFQIIKTLLIVVTPISSAWETRTEGQRGLGAGRRGIPIFALRLHSALQRTPGGGVGGGLDMASVSSALQWGWERLSFPPGVLRRTMNWDCGRSWALQSVTQPNIKCSRLFSQLSPQCEAASPEQRQVAPWRCCPRKPCNVCHGNT